MNSYGLNNLDIKVLEYIKHIPKGFYVECGANNGIWQSNTKILEESFGWSGLLVEPNFSLYTQCKNNRPNSIVENYAMVSANYQSDSIDGWFESTDYNNSLMARINADNPYKNTHERVGNIIDVPATTFDKLFQKHNITHIDFLSLDVEGYEIQVLDGFNLSVNRPLFILLETGNEPHRVKELTDILTNYRYEIVTRLSDNDILYKLHQ